MPQMRLHQTGHPGRLQLYLLRWLLLHVGLTDSRQLSFTYLNSPIQLDEYYEKGPDDSRILLIVPFMFSTVLHHSESYEKLSAAAAYVCPDAI